MLKTSKLYTLKLWKAGYVWWLILCVSWSRPWGAQIKHYFWVCLRGYFWMRLAFESENSVDCLPSVGEYHPVLRPEENKEWRKERFTPFLPVCLSWGISPLLPLDRYLYHRLPWSLLCLWTQAGMTPQVFLSQYLADTRWQNFLLRLYNHISQFQYTCTHIHTYYWFYFSGDIDHTVHQLYISKKKPLYILAL